MTIPEYEERGRSLAEEFLAGRDVRRAPLSERWDLLLDGIPVEVKARSAECRDYETLILEEKKAQSILKKYDRFFYFTYSGDDWLCVHRIDPDFLDACASGNFGCPKTTVRKSPVISKKCYILPVSEGEVFIKKDGKWICATEKTI